MASELEETLLGIKELKNHIFDKRKDSPFNAVKPSLKGVFPELEDAVKKGKKKEIQDLACKVYDILEKHKLDKTVSEDKLKVIRQLKSPFEESQQQTGTASTRGTKRSTRAEGTGNLNIVVESADKAKSLGSHVSTVNVKQQLSQTQPVSMQSTDSSVSMEDMNLSHAQPASTQSADSDVRLIQSGNDNPPDEEQEQNKKPQDVIKADYETQLKEFEMKEKKLIDSLDIEKREVETYKEREHQYQDKLKEKEDECNNFRTEISNIEKQMEKVGRESSNLRRENESLKVNLAGAREESEILKQHKEGLYKDLFRVKEELKRAKSLITDLNDKNRELNETNDILKKENTDLSTRYSKLASAQLKDNNPNIVDLNDPNRAMKLGEKYGELYNDTWTDACVAQQDLGIPDKEAIENLLDVLMKSYAFCEDIAKKHFDSVRNVLLYPYQDPNQQVSQRGRGLEAPQIPSSSKKAVIELRRQISSGRVEEIIEAFLSQMSKQAKTDKEKQAMEASKAYYLHCVKICWLMVLHDPPLCMYLDVKPGSKVDLNMYTVLSKGEKVDYLVWPPLLNGPNGGMLQKGVVEVVKTMKKAKTK